MQESSKSRRTACAVKSREITLAALLCICVMTIAGCATPNFYPIPGQRTVQFEHAKAQCQAAIAGRSPAYTAPSSPDDLDTNIHNLGAAIRHRAEQQNLFNACMLRHGWQTTPPGQAPKEQLDKFWRDLLYQFPGMTTETANKVPALIDQTIAELGIGPWNPEFIGEVGKRAMRVQTRGRMEMLEVYRASKEWNISPLHTAVQKRQRAAVSRLIKEGADVNLTTKESISPLAVAAILGYDEIATDLINAGANVDGQSGFGITPLGYTAGWNRPTIAAALIKAGANVNNTGDFFGWAPIHAVAFRGHAEIAAALIEAGARINATDKDGRTPLDIATDKKHWAIVDLLEKARAPDTRHKDDAQNAFEKGWRSVVVIETDDAQGSGVIVRPGVVATNCHVVGNGAAIRVYEARSRRAQTDTPYRAAIYAERRDDDLCLLIVAGLNGAAAKIRRAKTLAVGEKVFAIGAPKGLEYSLSAGVVSQLRGSGNDAPIIQTDAAISPGSSGGGLFDGDGNLVGITTFKRRGAENINFAIPAEWILDAL